MKLLRIAVAVAFAGAFGSAYAFHDGGVASCESCHTMHNSKTSSTGGAPATMNVNGGSSATLYVTNPFLLQGTDPSSTCLNCHGKAGSSQYHVLDPSTVITGVNPITLNYTPGGDFAWLQFGNRKGHNIVAADFPIFSKKAETRVLPPGAPDGMTWDGSKFSCVSCHDPHGQARWNADGSAIVRQTVDANGTAQVNTLPPIAGSGSYGGTDFVAAAADGTAGTYRLLGGKEWAPRSTPNQPKFAVDPPIALAPKTYNASEGGFAATTGVGPSGQTVVAYLSGMSEWCGTCHPKMHGEAASGTLASTLTKHPSGADAKLNGLALNYKKYVKTGDLTGTATYDGFVPVELGLGRSTTTAGYVANTAGSNTAISGAVGQTSNVMCLTCHRAHASGFDSMLRFQVGSILDLGTPGAAADTAAANTVASWYMRAYVNAAPYGTEQRALCNKCHVKD